MTHGFMGACVVLLSLSLLSLLPLPSPLSLCKKKETKRCNTEGRRQEKSAGDIKQIETEWGSSACRGI